MLGPYILHDEIARGGQGVVYRAVHSQLGNWVAIKVLLDPTDGGLKRFRQEAKVLARLDHPNILKVVDMGVALSNRGEEFPYIAMEYIEGPDLKTLLRDGYPIQKALRNLLSVAGALDYCHQMGITHRDLKPSNIVIEEISGRPVIIDFGLVKRDVGKMGLASLDRSRLSLTGEVKGTPQYMAPEQLDSEFGVEGPMVDIYALGGILYYILTGRTPFQGATGYNIMVRVMRDEAEDPRETDPGIPAGLAELSLAALSKDPGDRPGSAAIFAGALREALDGKKKSRGLARKNKRSGRSRRHRSRLIPGLIAGGIMASGLGGYGYHSHRQAEIAKQQLATVEASRVAERETLRQRNIELARQRLSERRKLEAQVEMARQEAMRAREANARARQQERQEPVLQGRAAWQRSTELFEEANSAWRDGDEEEGMNLVNQSLRIWSNNSMALVLRSTFNAQLGDKRRALDDIEKAILLMETSINRGISQPNNPQITRAKSLRNRLRSQRRLRRYYR